MVKIAAPISHLFEDGETARKIIASCDCLECRERSAGSKWANQELFHFDIDMNLPWQDELKAELSGILKTKPELRLASFQMSSCYDRPQIEDGMYVPGGRRVGRGEMLESAAENIAWIRELLGSTVNLAVENNNYYRTPAYEDVTDPAFIRAVVNDNGLGLLLDLAHAVVSAHNSGTELEEYLAGLPLENVVQLHLCSPGIDGRGFARDEHNLPDGQTYGLTRRFLSRGTVKYLTVEYYREADGLIESHGRLRELIANTSTGGGE
jgi:uncharacterized protein (UPF0276 family)